jgi:hypothetical protein
MTPDLQVPSKRSGDMTFLDRYSVFERSMSSGLTRGRAPVPVKKTRQNKKLEPGFDSIKAE